MSKKVNYLDKYLELRTLHWAPLVVSLLAVAMSMATLSMVSIKDANHFAVAIAVLQIVLAIAAFFGFWAVRSVAKEKSGDVARETVNDFLIGKKGIALIDAAVSNHLQDGGAPMINRAVDAYMEANDEIPDDGDVDATAGIREELDNE